MNMCYWSPPKKNNLRAWKRIADGDWLWDHRRERRAHSRHRMRQHRAHLARKNKGVPAKFRGDYKYEPTNADLGA
jgi:hypothetical protein